MTQEFLRSQPELPELLKETGVKGIIYDFDGLLGDTEQMWYEIFRSVLESLDVPFEETEWSQYIGTGNLSEVLIERYGLQISLSNMRQKVRDLLYPTMEKSLQAMPGAIENVKILTPYFPLAVASSSHTEYVKKGLEQFGISDSIQIIIGGDTVGKTKPAPDVFLKAANELLLDPSEVLIFEDSYNGMLAAKAAGARCIVIPSNKLVSTVDFNAADLVIPCFDDLATQLLISRPQKI